MAFLSVDFFLLLPAAVLVYHLTPLAFRHHFLLAASYLFYCTWSPGYAALLFGTSLAVQALGLRIEAAPTDATKKRLLALGIVGLSLVLAAFKYAPALDGAGCLANLAVPLGVSYYTFKLVSYLVDVYWERLPAERDIVSFALHPVFFPQILSGPIQRARDFLPQLAVQRSVAAGFITSGLRLMLFGLFKKFVVADRLSLLVNRVFEAPTAHSSLGLILASYAFAIQVYADFSGITDFAIGVGRLFGIDSPQNFKAPFYAPNIQEFWRRWHMTLSSWLTDYVFTPLRISLRAWGNLGLVLAITVNMVAIGAWHGPRWTFVVFGLVNAFYMIVSAFTLKPRNKFSKSRPRLAAVRRVLGPLVTFHLVVLAFILFRANTLGDAVYVYTHLFPADLLGAARTGGLRAALSDSLRGLGLAFDQIYWAILAIPVMELVQLAHRRGTLARVLPTLPTWVRWSTYYAFILVILLVGVQEVREFIYAQF